MLRSLKLLLPALIPSWNFFDSIGPSPRIEFALLQTAENSSTDWREFRPRPLKLSFSAMLERIFWNPRGNEYLFLVSCAERLIDAPTAHGADEIFERIKRDLIRDGADSASRLQFRLVFLSRHDATISGEVLFVSPPRRLAHDA